MRLVLSALILGAVSVTAFSLQNPLAHHPAQQPFAKPKHHPIDPFETFVNHFDSHRVATDTYLQTHLASLYPNRTMTVTQDSRFQLLAYAANAPDGNILVRQMDDVEILKRTVYINSPRRRDGDGKVVDMILFAGYEIAWGDKEFTAIVATWSEAYSSITQWHLFGTDEKSAHELIQACAAFNANVRNIVWVFEQGFWRYDRALWESIQQASWDDVVLDATLKRAIQNDYRSFFKSEDIYKKLNVPWKRGLIFLGPPGNGKTISLKAIMKEVQVPLLYVKSFHTYAGDELGIRSVFAQARALAPCVLVLEDLDSLITNQNRAFFLNEVDGLEDNDGLLLIGSTNHFDRLDPALSSRPSRFDRKYNFPNPNKAERREYAVYWQDKLKDNSELDFPDELLDKFAEGTDKFSFAYMKEVFVSTLLIIAGQEPGEEVHFGDLLMDQVKKIKKDIEDGEQLLAIGGGVGGMIGGGHDQEGAGGAGGYPPEEAEMLRGAGVGVQVDAGQKVFGKRL